MILRFRSIFTLSLLTLALAAVSFAQAFPDKPTVVTPTPTPTPKPTPAAKGAPRIETAEQVAESAIFFYGYPGGREKLNQIRKTTLERGRSSFTTADGKIEEASYQRFIIRASSLGKERIRLDQEFSSARYSLVFNDGRIYGIYNDTVFTPREDASKSFENQIVHSLEALLRYKENESRLELGTREKLMGVDYYILDVIDKQERKTRFFISAKSFRVMMLSYEEGGVKYLRKYYDYNYYQGTLVPRRSVLWANDKIVEETEVGTITFGQRVDEALFTAG